MRSRTLTILLAAALPVASSFACAQAVGKDSKAAAAKPSPPEAHYSFEVVSIRPSSPDTRLSFHRTPDGFQATGITLDQIVLLAYLPFPFWSHDRIQNIPVWVPHNRYDINAKVAPANLDAWTHQSEVEPAVLHAMLLSMLVDRCHLQVHVIPAEMPGFALVASHHGASLRASTSAESTADSHSMKLTAGGIAIGENLEDGSTTWQFQDASIASLANFLSNSAHTRILDQTGLTGRYNFTLTMEPDRPLNNHGEIMDPAIFWNLRALGLRTVPTKVATVNVVIDHIDPPSEN